MLTPAMDAANKRAARQAQAIADMQNEPIIQQLQAIGGTLKIESIKVVNT